MELPRHVHRYGGVSLIVYSQAELDHALAAGWHLLPPQTPDVVAEPVTDPDDTPTVNVPLEPKRRGRPRKTEG